MSETNVFEKAGFVPTPLEWDRLVSYARRLEQRLLEVELLLAQSLQAQASLRDHLDDTYKEGPRGL